MNVASPLETFMLTLVNEARAANGLAPLKLELNLNRSADVHTAWMVEADTFSHTGDAGSSATQRIREAGFDISGSWSTGENLAAQTVRGQPGLWDDVRDLHVSLMNSPGHRANILSTNYTHIGIGIDVGPLSYDPDGIHESILVTQNFGRTDGAVDQHLIGGTGANVIRARWGDDHITAGAGNDTIFANGGRDTVFGGDGDDTIRGGDGNDLLRGGKGDDIVFAGQGNDNIRGGVHEDTVHGADGDDRIFGDAGFDRLHGGDGDDFINGGAQADNLWGDAGNDVLLGAQGFDRLFGGVGQDLLVGGDSGDGLFGQNGSDTLRGDDGNDRLWGGVGNDQLEGGTGNDVIFGGAGFDTIDGGTGNDVLAGNFNADRFVFSDASGGFGNDIIRDFAANNPFERIDLSGVAAIRNYQDLMANHVRQAGNDVLIEAGENSSIRLRNVLSSDLDTSDFVF